MVSYFITNLPVPIFTSQNMNLIRPATPEIKYVQKFNWIDGHGVFVKSALNCPPPRRAKKRNRSRVPVGRLQRGRHVADQEPGLLRERGRIIRRLGIAAEGELLRHPSRRAPEDCVTGQRGRGIWTLLGMSLSRRWRIKTHEQMICQTA